MDTTERRRLIPREKMNDDYGWFVPWMWLCVFAIWATILENPFIIIALTLLTMFLPEIIIFFLHEVWTENPWTKKYRKEWHRSICQTRYGYYEFEGRYASYKKTIKRSKRRKVVNFLKRILHIK